MVPDHNPHRIFLQPTQASALMSIQPRLPVEVLEAVIDQASDHPMSLRNLSLTCITLLPRSRLRLFSVLVIRTVQQLEDSPEFLDSRPWLTPHVRKVILFVTVPGDNSKPNVRILDVVPIHFLTRLPNLRTWTMETVRDSSSVRKSPSLSLHHYALQCYRKHGGLIRNLELSAITFYSMSDFKALVSAFIDIDSLTCYNINFQLKSREQHLRSIAGTNFRPPQISTLKASILRNLID